MLVTSEGMLNFISNYVPQVGNREKKETTEKLSKTNTGKKKYNNESGHKWIYWRKK